MPDTNLTYRNRLLKKQLEFNRKYKGLFDKVANDFSLLANDPSIKFSKAFKFPPAINKKITGIIADFHDQVLNLTEAEITEAWGLSNQKNDKIVADYLKAITTIKSAQKAAYFLPNIPALKAFLSSPHGADTLSDSVWKIGKQLRKEMEIHLGIGISQGDSAGVISRRIRQYLNQPEALFRRIRDNKGRLVASQAMIDYRKANGLTQGVYTSAYKNALRTARSNTNAAYLLADNLRWARLDMVKGIKIELSAQHPEYSYPEICEVLEGNYPKTFIFTGWHSQCLCHQTPILSSEEDFMSYLRTGKKELNGFVSKYPSNFNSFVKENYDRFSNYKSKPFWFEDNIDIINNTVKKK